MNTDTELITVKIVSVCSERDILFRIHQNDENTKFGRSFDLCCLDCNELLVGTDHHKYGWEYNVHTVMIDIMVHVGKRHFDVLDNDNEEAVVCTKDGMYMFIIGTTGEFHVTCQECKSTIVSENVRRYMYNAVPEIIHHDSESHDIYKWHDFNNGHGYITILPIDNVYKKVRLTFPIDSYTDILTQELV